MKNYEEVLVVDVQRKILKIIYIRISEYKSINKVYDNFWYETRRGKEYTFEEVLTLFAEGCSKIYMGNPVIHYDNLTSRVAKDFVEEYNIDTSKEFDYSKFTEHFDYYICINEPDMEPMYL